MEHKVDFTKFEYLLICNGTRYVVCQLQRDIKSRKLIVFKVALLYINILQIHIEHYLTLNNRTLMFKLKFTWYGD